MSEKVLYEFIPDDPEEEGAPLRVIERDGVILGQTVYDGEYEDAPCQFAVELARLASRVAELKGEVAKLRALAKRSGYAPVRAKADNP